MKTLYFENLNFASLLMNYSEKLQHGALARETVTVRLKPTCVWAEGELLWDFTTQETAIRMGVARLWEEMLKKKKLIFSSLAGMQSIF